MTDRTLPPPFAGSDQKLDIIAQGAEALLFKTVLLSQDTACALKIRPSKAWRHAKLDKQLTRQRILAESRVLVKCCQKGITVPAVLAMDWDAGWLAMEWIDGLSVKQAIRQRDTASDTELITLMQSIGGAIAKLHETGIVHGDLTTSNMMLKAGDGSSLSGEIVLIDFGLAAQTTQEEDRAVDLYVLERAFASTHPKEEGYFGELLNGYAGTYKASKGTLRKLEDVRMRGRKKSMLG